MTGYRLLDGDGPYLAPAITTFGANIPANRNQVIANAIGFHQSGQLIDGVAFGQRGQIHINISAFLFQGWRLLAALQPPVTDPFPRFGNSGVGWDLIAARLRPEAPQIDQRPHRNIEDAAAEFTDAQCLGDYLLQFGRDLNPVGAAVAVKLRQLRIRVIGGHLFINAGQQRISFGFQIGGNGLLWRGREFEIVAGAHC